jgi:hypothetical protein
MAKTPVRTRKRVKKQVADGYIFNKEELKEKEFIIINGAVNKADEFDYMKGMQIEYLIALAGGLKNVQIQMLLMFLDD